MIKLKILSILLSLMVMASCSTTFKTTKAQNFKWDYKIEDYKESTSIYEREAKFKLNKRKIKFKVEGDKSDIDTHVIEVRSVDNQKGKNITIYKGILDGEFPCKLVHNHNNDSNFIAIFGDRDLDINRYTFFIIFGDI